MIGESFVEKNCENLGINLNLIRLNITKKKMIALRSFQEKKETCFLKKLR